MCYRTEASETVHCVCNAGMSPFTGNLLPLLFPQNHFLQSTSPFSFQPGNATLC